jgi:hypothetical protein
MILRALAACLISLCPIAIYGQTNQPMQLLPSKVKAHVDRILPGWKFLTSPNSCEQDIRRTVLYGDFNGDGKRDYVIKIVHNNNGRLIALISQKDIYKLTDIIRESASEVKDIGFTIGNKGTRVINQNRIVRLQNDIVLAESCATRLKAKYWVYRNGGFESM